MVVCSCVPSIASRLERCGGADGGGGGSGEVVGVVR